MTASDPQISALVEEMLNAITRFERDDLPLARLSWELKSRVAALEGSADPVWVEQLRAKRNEIEVISAVSIESDRDAMSDVQREEAFGILEELRAMLIRPVP